MLSFIKIGVSVNAYDASVLTQNPTCYCRISSSAFKNSITVVIAVVVYIVGAVSLYIDLVGKNRIEFVILLKIMESWLG